MPLEPAVCLQRGAGQAAGGEPSALKGGPQTRLSWPTGLGLNISDAKVTGDLGKVPYPSNPQVIHLQSVDNHSPPPLA